MSLHLVAPYAARPRCVLLYEITMMLSCYAIVGEAVGRSKLLY